MDFPPDSLFPVFFEDLPGFETAGGFCFFDAFVEPLSAPFLDGLPAFLALPSRRTDNVSSRVSITQAFLPRSFSRAGEQTTSCLTWSGLVSSSLVWSCLVLFCLALPCLALSCLVSLSLSDVGSGSHTWLIQGSIALRRPPRYECRRKRFVREDPKTNLLPNIHNSFRKTNSKDKTCIYVRYKIVYLIVLIMLI